MDDLEYVEVDNQYLKVRETLVGELDSSELLRRDEEAGIRPQDVDDAELLWVDEFSCIGCTWCADVARQTFKMTEPYGTAKVIQQGGDNADVVQVGATTLPKNTRSSSSLTP